MGTVKDKLSERAILSAPPRVLNQLAMVFLLAPALGLKELHSRDIPISGYRINGDGDVILWEGSSVYRTYDPSHDLNAAYELVRLVEKMKKVRRFEIHQVEGVTASMVAFGNSEVDEHYPVQVEDERPGAAIVRAALGAKFHAETGNNVGF